MKNEYTGLEVAIIGLSCRFPGAPDWRKFWDNLVAGKESVHFFSNDELIASGMDPEYVKRKDYVGAGAVLEEKEYFDAAFFDYRPDEAAIMNPSHRVFHQCAWEALEDAGYYPDNETITGVFAGAGDDLNWKLYSIVRKEEVQVDEFSINHLTAKDYLTTLLSYKLNLKGPSYSLNTACSTSLMAVNLACRSLWLGEAKMAIAGGVFISTLREKGYIYEEGMINSKDGHCRAFDANASGCVGGEGAGVVVLKRLKDAINDKDHIYAVIHSSSANNDGSNKVGFTAPAVQGQSECIRRALKIAKTSPADIGYIECHGTGTRLGDPIEIEALNTVFKDCPPQSCAIGSVKTNIGHLDAAAGVAGLIKTTLALYFKKIPPTLHFISPNPEINFEGGPFYVNNQLLNWRAENRKVLSAGVSSFGIGGTNVHVIIKEFEDEPHKPSLQENDLLLLLSAKTENALAGNRQRLYQYLLDHPDIDLNDVSYTMNECRKHFAHRNFIVFRNREQLLSKLSKPEPDSKTTGFVHADLVWMFPGQGVQFGGMCRELYHAEPSFKKDIDQGLSVLSRIDDNPYREILFSTDEEFSAPIHSTVFTQPLLFLTEYAVGQLLVRLGMRPAYMIGHSLGEYVAACLGAVFTLEEALTLIVHRARLMEQLPEGKMLSIRISEKDITFYITEGIWVSAVNSPDQVVVSGTISAIDKLQIRLKEDNVPYFLLPVTKAFHSGMLDSILEQFRKVVQQIKFQKSIYAIVGNVTGTILDAEQYCTPDYWVQHLRHTVLFQKGLQTLLSVDKPLLFVEVGPGNVLTSLVKQQSKYNNQPTVTLLPRHRGADADRKVFLNGIGVLWQNHVDIRLATLNKTLPISKLSLPTYAFERISYPVEVAPREFLQRSVGSAAPVSNNTLKDSLYFPSWKKAARVFETVAESGETYLLFSAGNAFTGQLVSELAATGKHVIEVTISTTFQSLSPQHYTINPFESHDTKLLFDQLAQRGVTISHLIYTLNLPCGDNKLYLEESSNDFNLCYLTLTTIIKNSLRDGQVQWKSLVLVTDRLHQVIGYEKIKFNQALMLGVQHCLPQEYSVKCRNIDVDLTEDIVDSSRDVARELDVDDINSRLVSFRYGNRWIQDFQRNTSALSNTTTIREHGLYIITGGLGNVGRIICSALVQKYQANIAILGRRHPNEITFEENEFLEKLRLSGGKISYYAADLTDELLLAKTTDAIESDMGPINGLFHVAGVVDRDYFELAGDITFENAGFVLKSKVTAIQHLVEIFAGKKLDFVRVTSSLSSLLGGVGFSSYAAANAYMEYYLLSCSKKLHNWKSIGLSELQFETPVQQPVLKKRALDPDGIVQLFTGLLSPTIPTVCWQTWEDISSKLEKIFSQSSKVYSPVQQEASHKSAAIRSELMNDYMSPVTETERILVKIIQDFFGIENVGILDGFLELGGDSLKAMMLLKNIRTLFAVEVSIKELLMTENIQNMSSLIDDKQGLKRDIEKKFISII